MKESSEQTKEEQKKNENASGKAADVKKTDGTAAAEKAGADAEKPAEEKKEEKPAKSEAEKTAEKIADLEKENADLKDQLLRRSADFDNYRKRMLKEKQDAYDYANTNLLQDLLESIDDFDRTIAAAATAKDAKSIADGISMINHKLVNMLETKYNLVAYGTKGDAFNPDEHQAIASEQGKVAEPVLKEVYLKG